MEGLGVDLQQTFEPFQEQKRAVPLEGEVELSNDEDFKVNQILPCRSLSDDVRQQFDCFFKRW